MPDEYGNIKGHGWTRRYGDAYERIFGNAAAQELIDDAVVVGCTLVDSNDALLDCCGDLGSGRPCEGCPVIAAQRERTAARPVPRATPREVSAWTDDGEIDLWKPEDYRDV